MNESTLTSEISAIQIKLFFLQFKSRKVMEEIQRIVELDFNDKESPEAVRLKGELSFCVIDVFSLFEGYYSLQENIFNNKTISTHLDFGLRLKLKNIGKITNSWKHVRNSVGGHLDIEPIKIFCEKHGYKGVFITDHLEEDFKGVLLLQMIESAVNISLIKSNLFESELSLLDINDLGKFISKLKSDWSECIKTFNELTILLYSIGKEEKLKFIGKEDAGIIRFKQ